MNHDFRSRVIMPIVLPILVLLTMAAFIGAIAASFLWNTNAGALMLAAVAAGGILFTVSLATSQDELGKARGGVLVFAAVLPIAVGGAYAAGLLGGIDDEDRKINVEPLVQFPEDTPVLAAQDSQDFCLLDEETGDCETTDSWEVVPSEEEENLSFVFENLEAGVPHNVVIAELEGSVDDPEQGEDITGSELVTGVTTDYYVDEDMTWDDLPDEWYFYCTAHVNMNGVGTVVEGSA